VGTQVQMKHAKTDGPVRWFRLHRSKWSNAESLARWRVVSEMDPIQSNF
jgi:hypothetical protein